ncbi:MAG TPA: hypothetical protein VFL59_12655 [Candidatus Nanopelagicales bacterium]|nr:hypothetical protein [Candidatus Nanopelagicales bacterium]
MDETTGTPTSETPEPVEPTAAAAPAAPEPAPETAPEPAPGSAPAATDDLAAFGEPTPPPAAPPAGAPPAAPGWYTTESGARYWDGTTWHQQAVDTSAKATYGEKWKRRFPVVLLIAGVLNVITAGTIALTGNRYDLGLSGAGVWIYAVGIGVGIIVSTAFWTSIVALFGGRRIPAEEKASKPLWRKAWLWAPIALVAAVLVSSQTLRPAPEVAAVTITSEAQGCKQFLTTFEDAAKANASVLGAKRYIQPLADAAATSAPQLAADLQPFLASPTEANLTSVTEAVVQRCVTDGHLTADEVNQFAQRMQSLGG